MKARRFIASLLAAVVASLPATAAADFGFNDPPPGRSHPVQPRGRFVGKWVTDMDGLKNYLNTILQPVNAVCESVEGPITYEFFNDDPMTMLIATEKTTVHVRRARRNRPQPDDIIFAFHGGHQVPTTVDARNLLLRVSNRADFGLFQIETVSVNGILFEGGEADTMGIAMQFGASEMRFEFRGDGTLALTPIIPPASDGVPINPGPIILRRK
ncbi:MAG TPA: hypothetical protein P5287_06805 [bacterium]|nr:hypothetical protein [bacterium]